MRDSAVIVMAAGLGTRMRSALPKVLHTAGGRPLVAFPIELAAALGCKRTVVVVGHGREAVEDAVRRRPSGAKVAFAIQERQLGTGHAVMAALPALAGHDGPVLVLSGDVPLLERGSVRALRRAYDRSGAPIAFLSFVPKDAGGYGRVLREDGAVACIKEARDCTAKELRVEEVNAGIYLIDAGFLRRAVKKLRASNAQGELYLTDLVALAAKRHRVAAVIASPEEVGGVNDRADLARVEALLRARTNEALMKAGVTMRQPETISVDLDAAVGEDAELLPFVQIRGRSSVGRGCLVETGAIVADTELEDGAVVRAYSVLDGAKVGAGAQVGPMARLRPGAVLDKQARVGNFVELKNTFLGEGSKANHLAYLGDGQIGKGVNVGAGTIFCNYDGFMKHRTVLEDGVFIGSDTQLVAPVTVGRDAYVASGSTVTKDVPAEALAISRVRQENRLNVGAAMRRVLEAKKKKQQAERAAKEEG